MAPLCEARRSRHHSRSVPPRCASAMIPSCLCDDPAEEPPPQAAPPQIGPRRSRSDPAPPRLAMPLPHPVARHCRLVFSGEREEEEESSNDNGRESRQPNIGCVLHEMETEAVCFTFLCSTRRFYCLDSSPPYSVRHASCRLGHGLMPTPGPKSHCVVRLLVSIANYPFFSLYHFLPLRSSKSITLYL